MLDAEGVNFSVGAGGTGPTQKKTALRQRDGLCLSDVESFIARLEESEESKKFLLGIVRKMPHGSLGRFRSNYKDYLKRKK